MQSRNSGHSSSTFARNRRATHTNRMRQARRRLADRLRNQLRSRKLPNPNRIPGIAPLQRGQVSQAANMEVDRQEATTWRDNRPNTVNLHLQQVGRAQVANLGATLMAMADRARSEQVMGLNNGDKLLVYVNLNGVDDPAAVQRELAAFQDDLAAEGTTAGVEVRLTVDGMEGNDFAAMSDYLQRESGDLESDKQRGERLKAVADSLNRLNELDRQRQGRAEDIRALQEEADRLRKLIDDARSTDRNPDLKARKDKPLDNLESLVLQRVDQLEQDPGRDLGQYGALPINPSEEGGGYERIQVVEETASVADSLEVGPESQADGYERVNRIADAADTLEFRPIPAPGEGYDTVPPESQYGRVEFPVESQYGRVEFPAAGEYGQLALGPDDGYGTLPVGPDTADSILRDLVEASKDGRRERSDNPEFRQIVGLLRVLGDLERQNGQVDPATLRAIVAQIQSIRAQAASTHRLKPALRARRNQALADMDRRLNTKLQRLEGEQGSPADRLVNQAQRQGQETAVIRDLFNGLPPDQQQALLQQLAPDQAQNAPLSPPGQYDDANAAFPPANPYDEAGAAFPLDAEDGGPLRETDAIDDQDYSRLPPPANLSEAEVVDQYAAVDAPLADGVDASESVPDRPVTRSLRYEGDAGESGGAVNDLIPPAAPTTIAADIGPNPMLYFQPNADGSINFRVDNEGTEVGWIPLERFCSVLATHWLTNGQPARLGFGDLNDNTKQGAIDQMRNWAGQGGLDAQVQQARQALGANARVLDGSQAVRTEVANGNLAPGTRIWFATDQHTQAALVQQNGDQRSYLVYDPNSGQATNMSAAQFSDYVQFNNKFVVG